MVDEFHPSNLFCQNLSQIYSLVYKLQCLKVKNLRIFCKDEKKWISCVDWGGSFTKIRPQAKIDNFASKNSNIIIEGLIWKRKDYFSWKNFETQKNDFINKFYFCSNLISHRFEPNFKKWCDSDKLRFIFLGKRFSTMWWFPIFENEFFNGWKDKKTIFQNKIFINKLLYLIIINSISKIGNGDVVENLFPKKLNHDLLESNHFQKFGLKR